MGLSEDSQDFQNSAATSDCLGSFLDLTLGLSYSFASQPINRPVDFNVDDPQSFFASDILDGEVSYRRLKVIIGFAFVF